MWSAMIGEIIHNFRSALNHLVFQLVILQTGTASDSSRLQFPIFEIKPDFVRGCFDKSGNPTTLDGLGVDAIALIKSLQPFATGEGKMSPLWHLHKLSNWDKHRSIYTAGASTKNPSVSSPLKIGQGLLIFPDGPFEDNTELFGVEVPPGPEPFIERATQVNMEGSAMFYIAFKE